MQIDSEKIHAVLNEIKKPPPVQNPWVNITYLVLLSLAFTGLGFLVRRPLEIASITFIILIHELGHLAAMKYYGYKNLRILIIPFLGGAATGIPDKNPGPEEKTVVAIMGPLPGILLGIIGFELFLYTEYAPFYVFSLFSFFINGFNLLPMYPLDGGHYWEHILFSKNYHSEYIFRLGTILLLLGFSFVLGDPFFIVFSLFLTVTVYASVQPGKIIRALEEANTPVPSTLADLDEDFVRAVLSNVKYGEKVSVKSLAGMVKLVRDKMTAEKMTAKYTLYYIVFYFFVFFCCVFYLYRMYV